MNADEFGRIPPHDIHAEQCTLGGMLMRQDAIDDVTPILRPGDHYRPAHQVIHEAILRLYEDGQPTDTVSVGDELTKRGEIARVGGKPYLHTLLAAVPLAENAGYYARIVRERAILRRLVEAGTRIVQFGYSGDGEAAEIADRARAEVDAAVGDAGTDPLRSMQELIIGALDEAESDTDRGLSLPWGDLTRAVSGLAPGQLIYVAARPGIGKSTMGAQLAAHVAVKLGLPALLVSMEMRAEEITLRLIAARAKVSLTNLLNREASDDDWARIARATQPLADSPLVIDYSPACGLAHIRSRLREMARTGPARILVVDYIGLMEAPRAENRQNSVAELSRQLKLIAGEFAIPIVALAQLNRGPEHRPDKRPLPSDLRDSGAQEQDADVILLLHRDDAYDRESPRAGEMDVIVAKNRTGPQCTVTLTFQGHYGRVVNMAPVADGWSPSSVLGETA